MKSLNKKTEQRSRRRKRIRAKVSGTSKRPRLSVFKSNKAIYAQLIDDTKNITIISAKGTDAVQVGIDIAKGAKVKQVVFDRGGYIYTGKVKALAEAARKAGLKF